MSTYNFTEIEKKWQKKWSENQLYKVDNHSTLPKYYALDMFPYPSGAGLHVGHPLGYIASDIVSRYKRLNGFNVLHPMGYDAFGLPAEQYAIQTGQHPAITTEQNVKRFREQLDIMGFSYDWSREVKTCDENYYKWTQWIFGLFFTHYYDKSSDKALSIDALVKTFESAGNASVNAHTTFQGVFGANEWNGFSKKEKNAVLNQYRLAFVDETTVNWCEALGTVLANEEVVNGLSERGGHPVVRKKMKQWSLRITAYADRLLSGLQTIDWSDSLKEIQKNWIGRSEGAEVDFEIVEDSSASSKTIRIFTTRPDTMFGATFMVLAPEFENLENFCSAEQWPLVLEYATKAKNRSEIERMADTQKTGVFTGVYALNPFTKQPIPVWVSDYVLAGYGTGAIMAVPAHDERDFEFAQTFNLPIIPVIKPQDGELPLPLESAYSAKDGVCFNSGFLDGLTVKDAIKKAIDKVENESIGTRKINYKLREAGFGRQRYWGEPFPIVYDAENIPYLVKNIPVHLPAVESYKPTGTGESPLAALADWVNVSAEDIEILRSPLQDTDSTQMYRRETDTMPGWAGSSWYFLRYMDPNNNNAFASPEALNYWQQVDLYVGGAEHATGHLLYSRFWTKFLFDLGYLNFDEPFKKLVNQGMIMGESKQLYVVGKTYIPLDSEGNPTNGEVTDVEYLLPEIIKSGHNPTGSVSLIHFPVEFFEFKNNKYYLTEHRFNELKTKYPQFKNCHWVTETINLMNNGGLSIELYQWEFDFDINKVSSVVSVEKMSKRWLNTINPTDVCSEYGADTLRMYEMFLGPLTDSKPWNTNGIEGVSRFINKFWRLFYANDSLHVSQENPTSEELKILHKTIKKITEDIENMSFNTSVSAFMVCVNELQSLKCNKVEILKPLLVLLAPFAPHIAEELWETLGEKDSIHVQSWPKHNAEYLIQNSFTYPISINGKTRTSIEFALDKDQAEMETEILQNDVVQKWLEGKTPKKVIVVKGRIVNVVV